MLTLAIIIVVTLAFGSVLSTCLIREGEAAGQAYIDACPGIPLSNTRRAARSRSWPTYRWHLVNEMRDNEEVR